MAPQAIRTCSCIIVEVICVVKVVIIVGTPTLSEVHSRPWFLSTVKNSIAQYSFSSVWWHTAHGVNLVYQTPNSGCIFPGEVGVVWYTRLPIVCAILS